MMCAADWGSAGEIQRIADFLEKDLDLLSSLLVHVEHERQATVCDRLLPELAGRAYPTEFASA